MSKKPSREDRRRFLATSSISAFVIATHRHLGLADTLLDDARVTERTHPLLLGLRLQTAAPIAEMKSFYGGSLGLPVLRESAESITIGCGTTPISFDAVESSSAKPFYHFAFNIPENQILDARRWQRERSELLPVFPRLRDPGFPNDVVHFSHWNAHSVFFLDPAGNVVEYIARHDLKNARPGPFGSESILHASEIAFTVDDVTAVAAGIERSCGLGAYRGGSDEFRALGDESGLLLVLSRGRNLSLGAGTPRKAEVHPVHAELRTTAPRRHTIPGYPYTITLR